MGLPWVTRGLRTLVQGLPLGYSADPWVAHEFMELAHDRVAHWSPMDRPWFSHGFGVLVHGSSMGHVVHGSHGLAVSANGSSINRS